MYDMVCYLDENIAGNPTYADFMTDEQLSQIHDARKEMDDGKAELEKAAKGLDTAEQKLKDGETQIAENEKKLADAETQLSDGEAAYQSGVSELAANESKLTQSESQLNAGDQQLKESENEIAAGESQLAAAEAELSEKGNGSCTKRTAIECCKGTAETGGFLGRGNSGTAWRTRRNDESLQRGFGNRQIRGRSLYVPLPVQFCNTGCGNTRCSVYHHCHCGIAGILCQLHCLDSGAMYSDGCNH